MINMIAILMLDPSFAGEALETSEAQTGVTFFLTDENNPYHNYSTKSYWDTNRNLYGLEQATASGEIDFPFDLPVPLEIYSSVQDAFDWTGRSKLAKKWEEKNIYPTFGIKYSFSRFELQDFAKSLMSLFTNMNQDGPKKGRRVNRSASFYLAFPEL